jgi:HlyD family secretion protein
MDGQQPYFKVRCRLNKTWLQLRNGYTGQLKKGMTIQARFTIARRTIFQLLYDKTSDWLNPNSN